MLRFPFFLILFCLSLLVNAQPDDYEVNIIGNTLAYSESFTIKQALDELKGGDSPAKGDKAFTKLKAGVEYQRNAHTFGIFSRREIAIDHSQGAADFLYLDKNKLSFPDDGYYDVELKVDDIQFKEYQYRYQFQLSKTLTLTPGISLISAEKLIKGELTGHISSANTFSGLEFSWEADLDYYYWEDLLLNRPNVQEPSAYGFSSYLEVDWLVSEKLAMNLQLHDPLSAVYWKNAPFTEATSKVDDALSIRQPAVSGVVGYERLIQKINPFYRLEAELNLQPQSYLLWRSESAFSQEFNYIGYKYQNDMGTLVVSTCIETHALELALANQYVQFAFITDSYDLNDARHAVLSVSAAATF